VVSVLELICVFVLMSLLVTTFKHIHVHAKGLLHCII
jgi:hypothetical protein